MPHHRWILSIALALATLTAPAHALIVTADQRLLTTHKDERVYATFISQGSPYTSIFSIEEPIQAPLFIDDLATPGDTESALFIGPTEIVFRLDVFLQNNYLYTLFTGPGSRNPDGLTHAIFIPFAPNAWYLAFEDSFNFDLDDVVVAVYGVPVIPEPFTLGLVGLGLTAGGAMIRRRRA